MGTLLSVEQAAARIVGMDGRHVSPRTVSSWIAAEGLPTHLPDRRPLRQRRRAHQIDEDDLIAYLQGKPYTLLPPPDDLDPTAVLALQRRVEQLEQRLRAVDALEQRVRHLELLSTGTPGVLGTLGMLERGSASGLSGASAVSKSVSTDSTKSDLSRDRELSPVRPTTSSGAMSLASTTTLPTPTAPPAVAARSWERHASVPARSDTLDGFEADADAGAAYSSSPPAFAPTPGLYMSPPGRRPRSARPVGGRRTRPLAVPDPRDLRSYWVGRNVPPELEQQFFALFIYCQRAHGFTESTAGTQGVTASRKIKEGLEPRFQLTTVPIAYEGGDERRLVTQQQAVFNILRTHTEAHDKWATREVPDRVRCLDPKCPVCPHLPPLPAPVSAHATGPLSATVGAEVLADTSAADGIGRADRRDATDATGYLESGDTADDDELDGGAVGILMLRSPERTLLTADELDDAENAEQAERAKRVSTDVPHDEEE